MIDQLWTASANTTSSFSSGNIRDRFQYGYDANSNVLYKNNLLPTYGSSVSELYHANSSATGNGAYGNELYKLSGTSASMVADINTGSSDSFPGGFSGNGLVTNGTTLYFAATTAESGWELWKTDGTSGGTVPVRDINFGGNGSNPAGLTLMGTAIYFAADDGVHGTELWKAPTAADYTDLYYSSAWQNIEERADGSSDASTQYVMSPVYVDALILRDADTTVSPVLGGQSKKGLKQFLGMT